MTTENTPDASDAVSRAAVLDAIDGIADTNVFGIRRPYEMRDVFRDVVRALPTARGEVADAETPLVIDPAKAATTPRTSIGLPAPGGEPAATPSSVEALLARFDKALDGPSLNIFACGDNYEQLPAGVNAGDVGDLVRAVRASEAKRVEAERDLASEKRAHLRSREWLDHHAIQFARIRAVCGMHDESEETVEEAVENLAEERNALEVERDAATTEAATLRAKLEAAEKHVRDFNSSLDACCEELGIKCSFAMHIDVPNGVRALKKERDEQRARAERAEAESESLRHASRWYHAAQARLDHLEVPREEEDQNGDLDRKLSLVGRIAVLAEQRDTAQEKANAERDAAVKAAEARELQALRERDEARAKLAALEAPIRSSETKRESGFAVLTDRAGASLLPAEGSEEPALSIGDALIDECARAAWSAPSEGRYQWHEVSEGQRRTCRIEARAVLRTFVPRLRERILSDAALEAAANVAEAEGSDHSEIDWQRAGVRAALNVALASLGAPEAAVADPEKCPVDAAYLERWRHGIVDTADHADEAPYIGQVRAMARALAWCADEIQRLSGGAGR